MAADDGPTLEISGGGSRSVDRIYFPRRTIPPLTPLQLRDYLAKKRRSRFRLIAGGLPHAPTEKTDDAKS